jgi:hypothetical protein
MVLPIVIADMMRFVKNERIKKLKPLRRPLRIKSVTKALKRGKMRLQPLQTQQPPAPSNFQPPSGSTPGVSTFMPRGHAGDDVQCGKRKGRGALKTIFKKTPLNLDSFKVPLARKTL